MIRSLIFTDAATPNTVSHTACRGMLPERCSLKQNTFSNPKDMKIFLFGIYSHDFLLGGRREDAALKRVTIHRLRLICVSTLNEWKKKQSKYWSMITRKIFLRRAAVNSTNFKMRGWCMHMYKHTHIHTKQNTKSRYTHALHIFYITYSISYFVRMVQSSWSNRVYRLYSEGWQTEGRCPKGRHCPEMWLSTVWQAIGALVYSAIELVCPLIRINYRLEVAAPGSFHSQQ